MGTPGFEKQQHQLVLQVRTIGGSGGTVSSEDFVSGICHFCFTRLQVTVLIY